MRKIVYVAAMMAVGLAGLAWAADDSKLTPAERLEALRERIMKDFETAEAMAEAGRESAAPEMLIAAGSLLLKANALAGEKFFQEMKVEEFDGDKGSAVELKSFKARAMEMFKDSRDYSKRSKEDGALIKAILDRDYTKTKEYKEFEPLRTAMRGAAGGPKRISKNVQAGKVQSFKIRFRGGEPAAFRFQSNFPCRFEVITPGQGELANSIVTNFRYTWTPRKDVTVTVKVHCLGRSAQYSVVTN